MSDEKIELGIKQIQKIKMTKNENENILKNVLGFSVPSKKQIYSPYSFISIFQRNHFSFYATLSILLIILGGSMTTINSKNSLPGNTLYPLKIGLFEPFNSLLKLSLEDKAQYEISLVKERVQETKILASRGELNKTKEEKVKKLIENHKDAFSKTIKEIKQEKPTEEIVATTTILENEMEENIKTLAITTEQENEENIKNKEEEIITIAKLSPELEQTETKEIDYFRVDILEDINISLENNQESDTNNQELIKSRISSATTTPISKDTEIKNNDDLQKYIDVTLPLFIELIKEENNFGDYKINKISFVALKGNSSKEEDVYFRKKDSNDAFAVFVNYELQTKNTKEIENNINNWNLNKTVLIIIEKNTETGGFYIKRFSEI